MSNIKEEREVDQNHIFALIKQHHFPQSSGNSPPNPIPTSQHLTSVYLRVLWTGRRALCSTRQPSQVHVNIYLPSRPLVFPLFPLTSPLRLPLSAHSSYDQIPLLMSITISGRSSLLKDDVVHLLPRNQTLEFTSQFSVHNSTSSDSHCSTFNTIFVRFPSIYPLLFFFPEILQLS